MIKPSDPRQLAVDLLDRSICAVQVAAVISDNRGIFAWGWNSSGPTGFGQHAECHCILRANRDRAVGATLYVAARRRRNGKPVLAMPCDDCARFITWAGIGKAVYRCQNGEWKEL